MGRKEALRYLPHNLVGHPLMAILAVLGFSKAAEWVHQVTLPRE
jgi:hypothetical protein